MRIAIISVDHRPVRPASRDWTAAPAVHVTELAAALAALGHDVRVHTRRVSTAQPEVRTGADGVTTVVVPAEGGDAFGQWLDAAWRDGWAPDVVHAHTLPSAVAAMVARKLTSRPTVVTFHGDEEGDAAAIAGTADAVVALSRTEAHGVRRLGAAPANVSVVPPGVDPTRFAPEGRAWVRRRTHRVLAVGQLVPPSGFAAAVDALPELPDTELVVVGRPRPPSNGLGPHAAQLRALAVNHGVHERLRLTGAAPYGDMPGWYRSADLLVCTPEHASFSRAAIEAMACGIPVVATAGGPLAEVVNDGVTGRLVPPERLAGVIRELLADADLRRAYGTAGARWARGAYDWAVAAPRTVETYERIRTQHALTHQGPNAAGLAA
ncbi:glycosyltransferase [Phytohabitans sp. ZYX-F-186]|uniref:Glycosyltransferase n=1 Tax=Phytohabitans maris TaxID=3071409 RepID=A0ABU0ZA40_9ACTN|nr:glycosyltransferase [Phytohabitans sp. ZYX-F-186]MDQ7903848.1 glycosyltransferase [Phytohabitans sp. ZYX-F-186]